MRKYASIFLVFVVFIVALYALSVFYDRVPVYVAGDTTKSLNVAQYWHEKISQKGGGSAYGAFKIFYKEYPVEDKHALAHIFGGELYEISGTEAFRICDTDFFGGCQHEFFGRAIQDKGLSVTGDFFSQCEGDVDCTHGIGHGLVSFFGYDEDDLEPALSVCKDFSDLEPLGCVSGVFMEYNMRTVLFASPRLATENPYQPCFTVSEKYRLGCFLTLPQWWNIELLKEEPLTQEQRISRMISLCSESVVAPYREMCMKGVNIQIAATFEFDPDRIGVACRLVGDTKEQYECIWQSIKLIVYDDANSLSSERLCSYVEVDRGDECRVRLTDFKSEYKMHDAKRSGELMQNNL